MKQITYERKFKEAVNAIETVIDGPWIFKNKRMFYSPSIYLEYIDNKIYLINILKTKNEKRKTKKYVLAHVYFVSTNRKKILNDFIRYKEINNRLKYALYLLSGNEEIFEFFSKYLYPHHYYFEKQKNKNFKEKETEDYRYPKDLSKILDILNEYIFKDFDYFFCFDKDLEEFSFYLQKSPFSNKIFSYITLYQLSNHEKLKAQFELDKMINP